MVSQNKTVIYGIAPATKLIPVVIIDESGRTDGEYISKGIIYAVDNGADIINLSLGSRLENDEVKDAVDYAYDNNVVIVSAVGDYQEESTYTINEFFKINWFKIINKLLNIYLIFKKK